MLFFRKKLPFSRTLARNASCSRRDAGGLTCIYLASYATLRFFVEFFREPDPQLGLFWGIFTLNQIFAFGLFCAAITIFMWLKRENYATMERKLGWK
jgi:prolipoprotein diacylglyceryltransferase